MQAPINAPTVRHYLLRPSVYDFHRRQAPILTLDSPIRGLDRILHHRWLDKSPVLEKGSHF